MFTSTIVKCSKNMCFQYKFCAHKSFPKWLLRKVSTWVTLKIVNVWNWFSEGRFVTSLFWPERDDFLIAKSGSIFMENAVVAGWVVYYVNCVQLCHWTEERKTGLWFCNGILYYSISLRSESRRNVWGTVATVINNHLSPPERCD